MERCLKFFHLFSNKYQNVFILNILVVLINLDIIINHISKLIQIFREHFMLETLKITFYSLYVILKEILDNGLLLVKIDINLIGFEDWLEDKTTRNECSWDGSHGIWKYFETFKYLICETLQSTERYVNSSILYIPVYSWHENTFWQWWLFMNTK